MKAPAALPLLLLLACPCLTGAESKCSPGKDGRCEDSQRKRDCPGPPSDVTVIKPKPPPGGVESGSSLPCSEKPTSGCSVADGFPKHTELSEAKVNGNLQGPMKDVHTTEEEAAAGHPDQPGHVAALEEMEDSALIQQEDAEIPVETPTSTAEAATTTSPVTTQEPTTVTTEDPNVCRRRGFLKPWPQCNEDPGRNGSRGLADALTTFSLELFSNILQKSSDPNLVFSPMSVALVLSHLLLGARDNTKALLLKNLFNLENDNSSNCVHSTLGKMVASQGFQSASGMFYRPDLNVNAFFLNQSKEFYKITPQPFTDSKSKNLEMVNQWVQHHTSGKIKNIIDDLDEDVRLVLVNAIFYMGKWINEFNPKDTKNEAFWGTENKVKMMHSSKYPLVSIYDAHLKARVGRFPLSDDMSMLIFLPQSPSQNALFELSDVLSSNLDIFQEVLAKLGRSFVYPTMVSLPRFKVDSTLDILDVFTGSGLEELFGASNLCGISDSGELMVTGGRHRAVLKMDEVGVTAAAATAVSLGRTAHVFEVDQPYIFIVWSERGKLPVMMGSITNPSI